MNAYMTPDTLAYIILIVGALFVHGCYQLSVSTLTLLSSHTIGRGRSLRRLFRLSATYTIGVIIAVATILVSMVVLYAFLGHIGSKIPALLTIFILPIIGLATVFWYYRRGNGTKLWLPRVFVGYLMDRTKKTTSAVESLGLGIITVVGELPFIIAPVAIIAFMLYSYEPHMWLGWSLAYGFLVGLPLLFITFYLTSGHSLALVQQWREQNKKFLQVVSGIALILLSAYLCLTTSGVIV